MASPSNSSLPSPNKRIREEEEEEKQPEGKRQPVSIDDSDSMCCGICLFDSGKAIRGQIDCCDHYFCFVCILEWAKVESRCPMCKRRFTTIRRPPKDGVFPFERIVNVPKRDQVYQFFGNATVGPSDPYAQVECSVCHGVADEFLLLLCDLCDSAAHTYCVGLGATVPEGDWFCHDCAVSRTEHDNMKMDDSDNQNVCPKNDGLMLAAESCVSSSDVGTQNISENPDAIAATEAGVSIFDIVHEPDHPVYGRLQRRSSSSFVASGRRKDPPDEETGQGERTPRSVADETTQTGARTLRRCRNVHGYIRALRENWNGLRSGSLSFSSSSSKSHGKCNTGATSQGMSGKPHSSPSTSGQQPKPLDDVPATTRQVRSSHEIDKAWKMMDMAKSVHQTHGKDKSVNHATKYPASKGSASKLVTNRSSCMLFSKSQYFGHRELGKMPSEKLYKSYSFGEETEKHVLLKLAKQQQTKIATKEIVEFSCNVPTVCSPGFSSSSSSWKVQGFSKGDTNHENGTKLLQKSPYGPSSSVVDDQNGSACLVTVVGPVPGDCDSLNAKLELTSSSCKVDTRRGSFGQGNGCSISKSADPKSEFSTSSSCKVDIRKGSFGLGKGCSISKSADPKSDFSTSSSCKVDIHKGNVGVRKDCAISKADNNDDAKSEIQSLVKLNLKLLNANKQLGVNMFKVVARLATHTILAACGLEHSKHAVHSFPRSICNHSEQIQQLHKSTLMPNSCRECFYAFVKDIVNTVLSEKVQHVLTQ